MGDPVGEATVNFGIVRVRQLYGLAAYPSRTATSVEVLSVTGEGLSVQVKPEDGGLQRLWVECDIMQVGRFNGSFTVRLVGASVEQLVVNVEANVMGPRDGRPSRTHEHVELLRAAPREIIAACNEGTEWKKAMESGEPDEDTDAD